jgi:hypothetical protein
MRTSHWTPSIVPRGDEQTIYLVLDDLGVWREADADLVNLETVIADLLTGQYKNPVRVIGFNTSEGWSQDLCGGRLRTSLPLRPTDARCTVLSAGFLRPVRSRYHDISYRFLSVSSDDAAQIFCV